MPYNKGRRSDWISKEVKQGKKVMSQHQDQADMALMEGQGDTQITVRFAYHNPLILRGKPKVVSWGTFYLSRRVKRRELEEVIKNAIKNL